MGAELRIYKRLVRSGIDPETLNGAISVLREIKPQACRMTYLSNGHGSDLLERSVALWLSRRVLPTPRVHLKRMKAHGAP